MGEPLPIAKRLREIVAFGGVTHTVRLRDGRRVLCGLAGQFTRKAGGEK